jgi:hypothetical protein
MATPKGQRDDSAKDVGALHGDAETFGGDRKVTWPRCARFFA